jgi:hypothetical protein
VSGKSTFDLPAMAEEFAEETSVHLSAVAALGRLSSSSGIYRNDRLADAQDLPAQLVVVLSIVGGISQKTIIVNDLSTLKYGRDLG